MSTSQADQDNSTSFDARNFFVNAKDTIKVKVSEGHGNVKDALSEVEAECFHALQVTEVTDYVKANWLSFFHIPFWPAFHKPGWLTRYAVGPHTPELFESFFGDFWAGITVALTLIPQVQCILQ